jgi:iron complex outermembrane receptor protein
MFLHALLTTLLSASIGGTLSGRVTTPAGTPIADVQVSLPELHRSTSTDSTGRYTIAEVPAGTFTISLQRIGYVPVVRRVASTGGDVTADVTMRETVVELTGIQVTASANATTALNSPQPVSVRAGEELRQSQAPSLGETLDGIAGVHSWSTGVGIGKPVIRGLTANRVLVLDDGQRLETAQWGDEHSPNVETANAERIEVIRGPASVLYGSDALGGVVNVVQKDLPDAAGGRPFVRGSLSAAYGTNNGWKDGAVDFEGASGSVGFRGTFSGRSSANVRTPAYELWNSGNESYAGSGTLGTRGSWGSLSGSFSQRNEKIELTDEDPAATPLQRIETSHGRAGSEPAIGGARLEVSTGYERNRRREFEDKADPTVALGLLTQTYLGDVHYHHTPLGPFSGLMGFSGVRNAFDKFGEETLIPPSTANNAAIYAFEQTEGARVNVSIGARYDYRKLSVDADTVLGVPPGHLNSLTGNLGLPASSEPAAWDHVDAGTGPRPPGPVFERRPRGDDGAERGKPNPTTEKSATDIALRAQTSRMSLEVGAFLNMIQDSSTRSPTIDSASGFEIRRHAGQRVSPVSRRHAMASGYVSGTRGARLTTSRARTLRLRTPSRISRRSGRAGRPASRGANGAAAACRIRTSRSVVRSTANRRGWTRPSGSSTPTPSVGRDISLVRTRS